MLHHKLYTMAPRWPTTSIPSNHRRFFVIFNVFFWCYSTTEGMIYDNDFKSTESHYNVAAPRYSNIKRCQNIYSNLTEEQLARFIDASGKPGSGIYGGNTVWYGSYSECEKLPDSRYCWTMFPGNMSLVENKPESYNFEWGVCMPDVCTNKDVVRDLEFFLNKISDIKSVTPFPNVPKVVCAEEPEYTSSVVITMLLNNLSFATSYHVATYTAWQPPQLGLTHDLLGFCSVFCGIIVGICLLATIKEIFKDFDNPGATEIVENGGHFSMDKENNEKTPLLPEPIVTKVRNDEGLGQEILHSFSMIRNIKTIMNTKVGGSDLTYLHGIRVLSLFWIIILHVNGEIIASFWPTDNWKDTERRGRKLLSMGISIAYGVDTFFVLSGLLVMYTNMIKKVKNNGQTNWFKYYFHRFWRLTPTYMFCILLIAKLRPFFGAGPLWFIRADTSACSDHWWRNLLYLNNFIGLGGDNPQVQVCLPHSWYLSADMQFFIISPLFLLIAYRYRLRPLVCVVGVFILASIIVTACFLSDNKASPLLPLIPRSPRSFILDINHQKEKSKSMTDFMQDVYIKPYCRISPYVMGMVLGYVLYEHLSKKFNLSRKFVVFMWCSAIALALTVTYAPYSAVKENPHTWTTGEKVLFGSLKWPIWGLCIAWLIFACHYNYAGLVKDILAAKFWIPLSHINYAAYIIHYDVIKALVYNIESPVHFTTFTLVTYFLSSLVLTYLLAFLIAVVVELPCANLEALAWKKWERK